MAPLLRTYVNLTRRLAYRWIPKCKLCSRPVDLDGVCWYHNP